MPRILFVCLGNICRSPMAEIVFAHEVERRKLRGLEGRSAGLGGWHEGEGADPRALAALGRRGYALRPFRSRPIGLDDFASYDALLAMDHRIEQDLRRMAPEGGEEKIALFLSRAPDILNDEVPDPYTGEDEDFDHVLGLIEAGIQAICDQLDPAAKRG